MILTQLIRIQEVIGTISAFDLITTNQIIINWFLDEKNCFSFITLISFPLLHFSSVKSRRRFFAMNRIRFFASDAFQDWKKLTFFSSCYWKKVSSNRNDASTVCTKALLSSITVFLRKTKTWVSNYVRIGLLLDSFDYWV